MYKEKQISLVIPAYNEQKLIIPTLEDVPDHIDRVFVVDDCSTDNTAEKVNEYQKNDSRVVLIQHKKNMGVGQAIINGYKESLKENYDIVVVVGGDNQMLLSEIINLLDPIINNETDYAKGNRFFIEGNVFENMPKIRQIGNAIITLLTKIASGCYKIYDVVDGYTAINKKALMMINWDKAWKGYGYPMDFLIRLNTYGLRVKDVPRTEIYLKGERQSQIKGISYALKVSPMLFRGFIWRLLKKYLFRDFHPLVFLYFLGILFLLAGIMGGGYLVMLKILGNRVSGPKAVITAIFFIVGFQAFLFAMLFDIYEEK